MFTGGRLACYLTFLPAGLLPRFLALDGFADVMTGGGPVVLRAGGASGAGAGGFRGAGGNGQVLADAAKPPADAGGKQPAGRAGPLPGQADVGGEVAGEPELGVGGDDEPGPPVGGGRVAQFRAGPAELLLEEPERVLDIEAAQERLPGPVHVLFAGGGAGGPQPQRLRVPAAGQAVHLEADEGALDDGQLALVVLPGGPPGELLVQPRPGHRPRGPVPGGLRDGCRRRPRPGRRLAEAEPVPGLPGAGAADGEPVTWYAHARSYAEAKWPNLAPVSRRSVAEALVNVTVALARKHRAAHGTRTIPIPPDLVKLLRAHIRRYGTTPDGRIFQTCGCRKPMPPGDMHESRLRRGRVADAEMAQVGDAI